MPNNILSKINENNKIEKYFSNHEVNKQLILERFGFEKTKDFCSGFTMLWLICMMNEFLKNKGELLIESKHLYLKEFYSELKKSLNEAKTKNNKLSINEYLQKITLKWFYGIIEDRILKGTNITQYYWEDGEEAYPEERNPDFQEITDRSDRRVLKKLATKYPKIFPKEFPLNDIIKFGNYLKDLSNDISSNLVFFTTVGIINNWTNEANLVNFAKEILKIINSSNNHVCILINTSLFEIGIFIYDDKEYGYYRIYLYDPNNPEHIVKNIGLRHVFSNASNSIHKGNNIVNLTTMIAKKLGHVLNSSARIKKYEPQFLCYQIFTKEKIFIPENFDERNKNNGFNIILNPAQPDDVNKLLFVAAKNNNTRLISYLIKNKANVNCVINLGRRGHLTQPNFLRKSDKKDITPVTMANQMLDYTSTPLIIAAENNCKEAFELLIKNGADINKKNYDGTTPLYKAVQNGHIEIVTLLLNQTGIQLSEVDHKGNTALHAAVRKGYLDIAEMFMKSKKVNPSSMKNKKDQTPLDLAKKYEDYEMIELLSTSI
ncbi:ankyrin repeat domain-containing protein [Spirobacillus cienkowskii]|uniref:ankyrin repeat domain-containing protein n=1 Tax=Spirobacillus cienkowskii TaxID=495820 RepID=UPI0030D1CC35